MMKRYITLKTITVLLFGLCSVLVQGQNNLKVDLPNFTPPSPEAFAITKYGDVPVDEFNGKVNLSIPVYEYQAGKLKLPLSLNYNGAGVKINDMPTQMGIGWLLNAGGLISREVRDIPDETAHAGGYRIHLTDSELSALNGPDCGSGATQLRAIIDGGQYDKEADIFHFNFQGQSGSFFFDNDFKPILTKNDSNLRIEAVSPLNTSKTFIITDESGVKYYFGGVDASEETSSRTVSNNGSWNLVGGGITGFYLYKIEHPYNGTIFLEYDTASQYETTLSKSYSLTKYVGFSGSYSCAQNFISPASFSFSGFKTEIFNKKEIKSIYSDVNAIKITFNRSAVNHIEFKSVLNNIEVKNGNVLLHKINMLYTGLENPNDVKRFFLTKVELDKDLAGSPSSGKKHQEYVLEYNNPDALPIRFSKSQDILGYFNNAPNTTTLVPNYPEFYSFTGADRTANLMYSTKGALTKVIYPTGGFSTFEYEAQPRLEKTYENKGMQTNINLVNSEDIPPTVLYSEMQFTASQHQIANLSLNVETFDNGTYQGTSFATAKLKIINITTGGYTNYGPETSFLTIPYTFEPGSTYKIEMELFPPAHVASGYSAVGTLNFDLHVGYVKVEGVGVRLKRTKDYASSDSPAITKRYYYSSYDKIGNYFSDNAPELTQSFKITDSYSVQFCHQGSFLPDFAVIMSKTLHSDNLFSDFSFNSSSLVDWANVTVSYGGDDFEQGGEEKMFLMNEKSSYQTFEPQSPRIMETGLYYSAPDAKSNVLSLDGLLIKSKTFKNINGTVFKIKEKAFEYSFNQGAVKCNLFGFKIYDPYVIYPGCNVGTMLSNYFIAGYNTYSYDFKKTLEKNKDFIDPVPANLIAHEPSEADDPNTVYPTQDDLEQSYKKLKTTQTYEYGTLRGLPTKITMTTSDSSINTIVQNVYADQANSLPNLTAGQIAANTKKVALNDIATPIQVSQYENNDLLSSQRTLYKQWNGNANLVLPEVIQTAKGNKIMEDRLMFEEYDTKGNPTLLSYKDGTKAKYLYNTNNQVIAKIENFSGTLDPNTTVISNACTFINQYPNSLVTVFSYDAVTRLLLETMDSNCRKTTYVYDAFHRLQQIKDHDGNVVKEFDTNYQPQ